jgi:CubicO group peptidase (beta-lactamase class C family)
VLSQNLQKDNSKKKLVIENIIQSYNSQNYKQMKKDLVLIGKVLISKKKFMAEYKPIFNYYGTAKIDTITNSSNSNYSVKLNYERSGHKRIYMQLYFNKNSKIRGLGFGEPPLVYSKKASTLSNADIANKIDSIIQKQYLRKDLLGFNGCVMALDKGNEVFKKCYGYSNMQTKQTLNDSTLFELASCSKQFTAISILMLAEKGKLKITDTLQKYIPELAYKNITIENLLTHTSGLPDYEILMKKHWDKAKFATNYDIITLFNKYNPKTYFKPNANFLYSNTGYALLSIIIERTRGQTYSEFLLENIFKPLTMNHSRVYNTRRVKNEIIDNYAYGYLSNKDLKKPILTSVNPLILPDLSKEYQEVIYQDAITGDGTVNSCMNDLIKWENALQKNLLVSPSMLKQAYKEHILASGEKTNYGYGFFLCHGNNIENLAYHTGSWPGYYSIILRFIDSSKSVIVITNTSYENFSSLADYVASLISGNY